MAVTVTIDSANYRSEIHRLLRKHRAATAPTLKPDAGIMRVVRLDLSGTYDTGGFAVPVNQLGLGKVTDLFFHNLASPPGYLSWSGGNIVIIEASGLATVAEKPNTSSVAAYVDIMCVASGY